MALLDSHSARRVRHGRRTHDEDDRLRDGVARRHVRGRPREDGQPGTLDFKLMSADAGPARARRQHLGRPDQRDVGRRGRRPVDGRDASTVDAVHAGAQHGRRSPCTITPRRRRRASTSSTPVNMWMPGLWETTITADAGHAAPTRSSSSSASRTDAQTATDCSSCSSRAGALPVALVHVARRASAVERRDLRTNAGSRSPEAIRSSSTA